MSCNKNNIFVDYIKEWLSSDIDIRNNVKNLYLAIPGDSTKLDQIVSLYKSFYQNRSAPLHEPDLCNTADLYRCIGSALDQFL